eukprot:CAMPEP_0183344362 /NCGR_PEP_ID=MMETSP0164_2-20130417/10066_1 /TAXON_ID=221442 /ORGANISM="Coccolithus pelagicus ssp braarudi, Strain PLY182g" /LENGTH=95 /DNA_ID=CAMNT_0025515353 /DNA_START=909 /DNA_END=1196 /DNA_ORIENTATION=+
MGVPRNNAWRRQIEKRRPPPPHSGLDPATPIWVTAKEELLLRGHCDVGVGNAVPVMEVRQVPAHKWKAIPVAKRSDEQQPADLLFPKVIGNGVFT